MYFIWGVEGSQKTEKRLTYNFEELVSNEGKCFLSYDLRNTNFARTLIDAIKKEKRKEGKEGMKRGRERRKEERQEERKE